MKKTTLALLLLLAAGCEKGGEGPDLPACGTDPMFTAAIVQSADFLGLVPLGALNPPGHVFPTDHNYFYVRREGGPSGPPASVPVFSPGAVTIASVTASEHVTAGFTDYAMDMYPCADVRVRFGHVITLTSSLAARIGTFPSSDCDEYSTGGETFRNCRKSVDLALLPGEAIGTAGGQIGQNALDVGTYDTRIADLPYANPSRWNEQTRKTVCIADYYEPGLAAELRGRFSTYDGSVKRTVEPLCGTIAQDVPGTAQGAWFVAGTTSTYPEDPHLALVHDMVDPTLPVFSVGTSIPGWGPGTFPFTIATNGLANRDFDDVAPGAVHCWDVTSGRVLASLPDATHLSIEHEGGTCGAGPWSHTSPVAFER